MIKKALFVVLVLFSLVLCVVVFIHDSELSKFKALTPGDIEDVSVSCAVSIGENAKQRLIKKVLSAEEAVDIGSKGSEFIPIEHSILLFSNDSAKYHIEFKIRKSLNQVLMFISNNGTQLGYYKGSEIFDYVASKCMLSKRSKDYFE